MPLRFVCIALLCAGICSAAGIHIELTRGAGLNNRPGVRGQPAAIRVTDDEGKPVAGALVIFTAPSSGPSLDFGAGPAVHVTTDDSGTASTPASRPEGGYGPVSIGVLAAKDGMVANLAISEMNMGSPSVETAGDMEIVAFPDPKALRGSGDRKALRVRVTDPSGNAVTGAMLTLRLYHGKNLVLNLASQTRTDGVAEFQVEGKLLKGLTEVPITATARDVTATRIVAINQIVP